MNQLNHVQSHSICQSHFFPGLSKILIKELTPFQFISWIWIWIELQWTTQKVESEFEHYGMTNWNEFTEVQFKFRLFKLFSILSNKALERQHSVFADKHYFQFILNSKYFNSNSKSNSASCLLGSTSYIYIEHI